MSKKVSLLLLVAALSIPAACTGSPEPLGANARFEVGFSPDGQSQPLVLKAIAAAREEVLVAAYSFTSKPVASALAEAHARGVRVQVVADRKANQSGYTAVTFLANQGVPVRLNGNYPIHHHKFMVIDGRHLETGSFNYSKAAFERNAENVLVLWDVPAVASTYAREWHRLWDESEPFAARH